MKHLHAVVQVLKDEGYAVRAAENGRVALAGAQARRGYRASLWIS